MTRLMDRTFWGLTIGLVAVIVLNFFLADWMVNIALETLSRGVVAIGLLILWRTGLISFGHALFFGFAAYTVVFMQMLGVNVRRRNLGGSGFASHAISGQKC